MNIELLKQRAAADIPALAAELLPQGRREGRHWVVGDIDGTPGKSVKITLTGSHAGLWNDFAVEGMSGDVISLVMLTRHLDFHQACEWLAKRCGLLTASQKPSKVRPYRYGGLT